VSCSCYALCYVPVSNFVLRFNAQIISDYLYLPFFLLIILLFYVFPSYTSGGVGVEEGVSIALQCSTYLLQLARGCASLLYKLRNLWM
jgi:hypothetical protein